MSHASHRTRIKICGLTRVEDALVAARMGADAIGLVFYAPSPRAIDPVAAARIRDALPPFVQPVALFVNPTEDEVQAVLRLMPEIMPQFHGGESPEFCASFGRPYLKALPMGRGADPVNEAASHPPPAVSCWTATTRAGWVAPGRPSTGPPSRPWTARSSWPAACIPGMSSRRCGACAPGPWMSAPAWKARGASRIPPGWPLSSMKFDVQTQVSRSD